MSDEGGIRRFAVTSFFGFRFHFSLLAGDSKGPNPSRLTSRVTIQPWTEAAELITSWRNAPRWQNHGTMVGGGTPHGFGGGGCGDGYPAVGSGQGGGDSGGRCCSFLPLSEVSKRGIT